MKTFITKNYEIQTDKLKGTAEVTFAVLADLHGRVYGANHADLLGAIRNAKPDAVLVPGEIGRAHV